MLDFQYFYWVMVPLTFVGGFARGFAGFGGPLLIVPVLTLFMPPATTVAVIIWIDVFVNVRLLPDGYRHADKKIVAALVAGTLVAMPGGTWLLVTSDPMLMKKAISGAILAAALFLLGGWRYPKPIATPIYGAVGLLAGFVMGLTSIAATTPLFLHAGNRTATENRAIFIVWVFFASVLLLALIGFRASLIAGHIDTVAILSVIYIVGAEFGTRTHYRVAETTVRRAVLAMVIVAAVVGLAF